MALVTMKARISGIEKTGKIEKIGQAYLVEFDGQSKRVQSLSRGLEQLGSRIRDYLKSAWGKEKLPWGLFVTAAGNSAVYGDYPRFQGRGTSPFATIRERHKEEGPPMAAVSNAIQFAKKALGI